MNDDKDDKHIRGWFKNHEAKLESFIDANGHKIEMLKFANPKSSEFWIRWYCHLGFLHIVGDIGEAIHQWTYSSNQRIDLKWIAGCDYGYYMGKLRASREGGKEWDESTATEALEFLRADRVKELEFDGALLEEARKQAEEEFSSAFHHVESEYAWLSFLEGSDLFGDDYCEFSNIGKRTPIRYRGHWLGLKLAFEALRRNSL